ncbi:MAG: ribosome silencing factor [Elusimicrobiales bacterium]|nr:ribosome silencing factor [Elusimicrobiales bacterium]
MNQKKEFKKIALLAAGIGSEKKASNIEVYELTEESSLAFYIVVMTAESYPQMSAIEDDISRKLKQKDAYILYRDGPASKKWKIIDYGGIIVHIFDPISREFYSLDKVYHDFKKVKWEKAPVKKPVKKIVKKAAVKKKTVKKKTVKKTVKKAAVKKPVKKIIKKTVAKKAVKKVVKKAGVKKKAVKKKTVKKVVKKTVAKKAAKKAVKKTTAKKPVKKVVKKTVVKKKTAKKTTKK